MVRCMFFEVSLLYGGCFWLNIWIMTHVLSNKKAVKKRHFFLTLSYDILPFLLIPLLNYRLSTKFNYNREGKWVNRKD